MKIWCLSTKHVQYLYSYICYCEEDPVELLMCPEYNDTYNELMDDLWEGFSYFYKEEPEEDTSNWDEYDWDDYDQEQFQNFCDNINFESYETNEQEAEHFPILIDER